ncbi:MAG: hypothetical protein K6V97_12795 [Actinomycetia bacterium]|nr:hypothetical protein [Actinomycetes bacterium]
MDPDPKTPAAGVPAEDPPGARERVRLGHGAEQPSEPMSGPGRNEGDGAAEASAAPAGAGARPAAAAVDRLPSPASLAEELRHVAMTLTMLAIALDGLDTLLHRVGLDGGARPAGGAAEVLFRRPREPAGDEGLIGVETLLRRYLGR